MNKLISIIVPCYNQARFLDECLQSVLEQTYQNWECIIVNDGSPDNTKEVAQKWLAKDNRFKYIEKENGGLSSARNAGLKIAKGDFVQFLDNDDLLHKQKLDKSLQVVQDKDDIVAVTNFSKFETLDKLQEPWIILKQEKLTFENILYNWDLGFAIPIHCGLFPSSRIQGILFDEKLKAKEDWLFWIRVSQNGVSFLYLDEKLALYRNNPTSMTATGEGMFENQVNTFRLIKQYVSNEEYENFLLFRVENQLKHIQFLKREIWRFKTSKVYKTTIFLSKIIKKISFN